MQDLCLATEIISRMVSSAQKAGKFPGILAYLFVLGLRLMSESKKEKMSTSCFLLWFHFSKAWARRQYPREVESRETDPSRLGENGDLWDARNSTPWQCPWKQCLCSSQRGQFWATRKSMPRSRIERSEWPVSLGLLRLYPSVSHQWPVWKNDQL